MSHAWMRARGGADDQAEGGFTLIEMIVAITLGAVIFAALAGAMAGGLRALSVQKTRTQGNEAATQGIEDLQRYSFDKLVLCSAPPGTAPDGLGDTVFGANCPADTSSYGEDPCNGLRATDAPSPFYTCRRLNTNFHVSRYVAWTDASHTGKRLAVYVDWADSTGTHTVSQQSSLRSPSGSSIIGLAAPNLSNPTVPANIQLDSSGHLTAPVSVSVTASNLTSPSQDRVYVTFNSLDPGGNNVPSSVAMTATDQAATSWTGSIPIGGYTFGQGSQFFTFSTVRATDGKTNATISGAVGLCVSSCSASSLPKIVSSSTPSTVSIDASGALRADVSMSLTTQNVLPNDAVYVLLPTLDGVQTIGMQPADNQSCDATSCTWTAVIQKATGYAFAQGTRYISFAALQDKVAGSAIDQGNTVSAQSTQQVTFG